MGLVASIAEKLAQLAEKVARWTGSGMQARLYVNQHTPTAYDTLSDYDPCTVDGVNPIPSTWPYSGTDDGDGSASVRGAFLQWTPTGTSVSQDVYGVCFTNNLTGLFQFAQRFDTPFLAFGATLDPILVVPVYYDRDIP